MAELIANNLAGTIGVMANFELSSKDRVTLRSAVDATRLTQKLLAKEARVGEAWLSTVLPSFDSEANPDNISSRAVRVEPLFRLLRVLVHKLWWGGNTPLYGALEKLVELVASARGEVRVASRIPEPGSLVPFDSSLYIRRAEWDNVIECELRRPQFGIAIRGAPGAGKASTIAWIVKELKDAGIRVASFVGGESIRADQCTSERVIFEAIARTARAQWGVGREIGDHDIDIVSALANWLVSARAEVGRCILVFDKLERLATITGYDWMHVNRQLTSGVYRVDGQMAAFQCVSALARCKVQGELVPELILCSELHNIAASAQWITASQSLYRPEPPLFDAGNISELVNRLIQTLNGPWRPRARDKKIAVSWLKKAFGGHAELTHRAILEMIWNPVLRSKALAAGTETFAAEWKEQLAKWIAEGEHYSTPRVLERIMMTAASAQNEDKKGASDLLIRNQLYRIDIRDAGVQNRDVMPRPASAFVEWLEVRHQIDREL